jgi:hypothetical protein
MFNLQHKAYVPEDDGLATVFRWHWPRGTFEKRMSAYEIASFLLPHMPSVATFFTGRIRAEFDAMLVVLATSQKTAIDEVLPWIKPVIRTEDDDIIELCVGAPK